MKWVIFYERLCINALNVIVMTFAVFSPVCCAMSNQRYVRKLRFAIVLVLDQVVGTFLLDLQLNGALCSADNVTRSV